MAVIGINYEASYGKKRKITKYKGVSLRYRSKRKNGDGLKKEFKSGDFIKDWFNAKAFFLKIQEYDPMFSHSSSVDHFFMDGAEYTSAYLHSVEELYIDEAGKPQKRDVWVLKYDGDMPEQEVIEGWEFFVPKGSRWTMKQLQDYVKKGINPDAKEPVKKKAVKKKAAKKKAAKKKP